MRQVDLSKPGPVPGEQVSRRTRYLEARLKDFGPGGLEVLETAPEAGFVSARFPGHDTGEVLSGLARRGVTAERQGDCAVFRLNPAIPFEDLDSVWGCLFEVL